MLEPPQFGKLVGLGIRHLATNGHVDLRDRWSSMAEIRSASRPRRRPSLH